MARQIRTGQKYGIDTGRAQQPATCRSLIAISPQFGVATARPYLSSYDPDSPGGMSIMEEATVFAQGQ